MLPNTFNTFTKGWKAVLFLDNGKQVYWFPGTNNFVVLDKIGLSFVKPTEDDLEEITRRIVWKGEEE
jgi:hypothetical protein